MKIDELYFGYTPYSKYALNEGENTDSSNDNSEQESSAGKKNTKEKVNKNTKVNIDAYFKLTKEAADNKNGTKGFAEELEDLLNTPHVADSMASELAAEKEHGELATKQAIINNQQIKDLKISADALSRENKHMADIIVQQETTINNQEQQIKQLKNNQGQQQKQENNQGQNNTPPENWDDALIGNFDGLNKR